MMMMKKMILNMRLVLLATLVSLLACSVSVVAEQQTVTSTPLSRAVVIPSGGGLTLRKLFVFRRNRGGVFGDVAAPIVDAVDDKSMVSFKSPGHAVTWALLLALNTGFINGCCLAGFVATQKQGVSAVTGAWTNSAIGAASMLMEKSKKTAASSALLGGKSLFRIQTSVLLSYIGGSAIYGILNPKPQLWKMPKGPSAFACLIMGTCLVVAATLAKDKKVAPLWTFCLAAVACGLQNSLTSAHSGNLLRTAHYSGLSSDLGTFGGQWLRGNSQNTFKFQTFLKVGIAFWIGGFAAMYFGNNGQSATNLLSISAILPLLLGLGILVAK